MFSRRTFSAALIAAAVTAPLACSAQDGPLRYTEGTHYQAVRQAANPETSGDTVQVAEVFWYGCNHCFRFDPIIEQWKADLGSNVEFVRIPTSLGRNQALNHSRAYYTAEALGVLDQVHTKIFEAIHRDGKTLYSEDQIAELFEDAGVDRERFTKMFNSFTVESRVKRAEQLVRQYGIPSVPSLVIDGQYWTNGRFAGGFEEMLDVADFLAVKQRQ